MQALQKIKDRLQPLGQRLQPGWKRFRASMEHHWFRCLVIAAIMAFVTDVLNLRSLSGALLRIITYPQIVVINYLFILLPLSLSCLFRRQLFATVMCALPWAVIVVVNFGVQSYRFTPLAAVDFALIPSFLGILDYYFSTLEIILFAVALVMAIGLTVLLFRKSQKHPREAKKGLVLIGVSAGLIAVLLPLFLYAGVLSTRYMNMKKAYHDYGLPYCFLVSIFDRGIDRPEDYSDQKVNDALNNVESSLPKPVVTEKEPNVIFLQLESFMDAQHLKKLTYTADPTPYFRELKEQFPSGYLTVPTYGAGTVNTEFEVLSGMSLACFGAGEYPYTSVLLEQTCETVAYNLKENGYTATAIHNNTATFYDRNLVFANMGFDRFISEEFMADLEYTPVGWPKDTALLPEILTALQTSSGRDLIYAISVQPHGKYPSDMEDVEDLPIQLVTDPDKEPDAQAGLTYYVNQLKEVDDFLRELTQAFSQWDEPVMLVIFGDHLPNFVLEENDVRSGDLFKTEYLMWTNYTLEEEDENLMAYQLSAKVLGSMGCHNGTLNRLHQSRERNEDYQGILELFQYDMLYGEKLVYRGQEPYAPTALQLGFAAPAIDACRIQNGAFEILGSGFTASSVVYYGAEEQDTVLSADGVLQVSDELPQPGDRITVRQVASNGTELVSSEPYTWNR